MLLGEITQDQANEYRALAYEKCDKNGEVFLAHYFQYGICASCVKMTVVSVLRSRRDLRYISASSESVVANIITRKWCTECLYFHIPRRTPVRS